MRPYLAVCLGLLAGWVPANGARPAQQEGQDLRPTFRTGVDRVAVSVTVRDRRGRSITTLGPNDFQLFDRGEPRRITEFRTDDAPVSIALLADLSGSMDVASKREETQATAQQLLAWLTPGVDQVGLFAFDAGLDVVEPLRPAPGQILERLAGLRPYGKTRLFDAIAETGRQLAETGGPRRAIVVLTDGLDNGSQMTPADVSGYASSIDVPVYIILIVSPLDRAGRSTIIDDQLHGMIDGPLGHLAAWTGGDGFAATSPGQSVAVTRQIVTELRHQYLMAFEPSRQPGWHPIDLRTRDRNHVVRARSGYVVPGPSGGS